MGRLSGTFCRWRDRPKEKPFTNYPHLSLEVYTDQLQVAVTIPNGVARAVRKRLTDLGDKGLIELNGQILEKGRRIP